MERDANWGKGRGMKIRMGNCALRRLYRGGEKKKGRKGEEQVQK